MVQFVTPIASHGDPQKYPFAQYIYTYIYIYITFYSSIYRVYMYMWMSKQHRSCGFTSVGIHIVSILIHSRRMDQRKLSFPWPYLLGVIDGHAALTCTSLWRVLLHMNHLVSRIVLIYPDNIFVGWTTYHRLLIFHFKCITIHCFDIPNFFSKYPTTHPTLHAMVYLWWVERVNNVLSFSVSCWSFYSM